MSDPAIRFLNEENQPVTWEAVNELNLAAECVFHLAKTGELYPGLEWEEGE